MSVHVPLEKNDSGKVKARIILCKGLGHRHILSADGWMEGQFRDRGTRDRGTNTAVVL